MSFRFGRSSWKDFSKEELEIIEKERVEQRKKNETKDEKKTFGKVCRACSKPNSLSVNFCTGCGFNCTEDDVQQLPDNVFMNIIMGIDTTKPLYKDENFLVFNDKFGVSTDHLDIIPTKVIEDITHLTKDDIPMLEKLYDLGMKEFENRNLERFKGKDLNDYVTAGYNFPVSVKHLHLHLVLPPFSHKKVFQYPRWHNHKKVIHDLKTYGKVMTYDKNPNDEEGKEEYESAMTNHELFSK